MASGEWLLHWDNSPLHTARTTKAFLDARGIEVIDHPPYSPDLAPCDFFLFPTVKTALAGTTIDAQTVKWDWERATKTIGAPAFTAAYRRCLTRHEKCVRLKGGYVEKEA